MTQENQSFISRYKIPLLVAAGILVVGAIGAIIFGLIVPGLQNSTSQGQSNPPLVDTSTGDSEGGAMSEESTGLQVNLSSGQAEPDEVEAIPQATTEPLSEEEIEAVLVRLPSLIVDSSDQVDFNLPEESLPPPRTGDTIEEPFPPPGTAPTPAAVDAGPLEVVRFAPEGEIPLAPFLNVTFNQPMVPLGTLEDLAAEDIPVQLEPNLPGTWRWLGTKTLTFQFDSAEIDRLPMATEYQATVPAGTESAVGGALAETVSWKFSTPPVQVISRYPVDIPQPLDPIIVVG